MREHNITGMALPAVQLKQWPYASTVDEIHQQITGRYVRTDLNRQRYQSALFANLLIIIQDKGYAGGLIYDSRSIESQTGHVCRTMKDY